MTLLGIPVIGPVLEVSRVAISAGARSIGLGDDKAKGGVVPAGSDDQFEAEKNSPSSRSSGKDQPAAPSRQLVTATDALLLATPLGVPIFAARLWSRASGKSLPAAAADIASQAAEVPAEIWAATQKPISEVVFWMRLVLIVGIGAATAWAIGQVRK